MAGQADALGSRDSRLPARLELPVPFAIRTCNAWLLPGPRPILVDCGVATNGSYAQLLAGLRGLGVQPAALRLVVTHGHVDHAGNAARLQREHGVPVLAPAAERTMLRHYRRDEDARNDAFAAAAIAHGMPASVAASLRARSHEVDTLTDDVPVVDDLRDGDVLDTGDVRATVRLTPGHTAGSLLLEGTGSAGWVVTGDTLLQHITSNSIELLDEDRGRYAQYVATLGTLRRYVGWTALPGHHAPFPITDALLDDHLGKHARRSQRILDALGEPHTAWELLPRVLPHLAKGETFLGMCEVVGHLHALELAGHATMATRDGIRRFQRTR